MHTPQTQVMKATSNRTLAEMYLSNSDDLSAQAIN